MPRPVFIIALLLTVAFTLATSLQLRVADYTPRNHSDDPMEIMLGDARRLFANHFFAKADIYFHSGYYPSIFDRASKEASDTHHLTSEHAENDGPEEHESEGDFLGKPKDWIDRFGRNFYSSTHSHLDGPGEAREILPWLRLAADMDPQQVETYTVASYWLRKTLNQPGEAEKFLREGWHANPKSYEILYELGSVYYDNRHDPVRARNLWELALRYWQEQDATNEVSVIKRYEEKNDAAYLKPDLLLYQELVSHLSYLEDQQGNFSQSLHYLEMELQATPLPDEVRKQIADMKQKIAASPNPAHK